jgi:hypothetical protein
MEVALFPLFPLFSFVSRFPLALVRLEMQMDLNN